MPAHWLTDMLIRRNTKGCDVMRVYQIRWAILSYRWSGNVLKGLRAAMILAALHTMAGLPAPADAAGRTERVGDILQVALPAVAYGLTFHHDDPEGRKRFVRSAIATSAATHALKHAIDAKRPGGGNLSFPSGHTSSAFQGAAFIHARYGLRPAVPAYLAAGFVGFSRVHAKKHHLADVLLGAALGISTSLLLTPELHQPRSVIVAPSVGSRSYGFQLLTRW